MTIHSLQLSRWSIVVLAVFCSPFLQAKDYLDTLVTFTGGNGSHPMNLIQTDNGDFYGVTTSGGRYGKGTLFRIPLNEPLITLVHFNGANGNGPCSRLVRSNHGTFYGTTCEGGPGGKGTVFEVSPSGNFKTLISFHGPDGDQPDSDLIALPNGTIYGCTSAGGTHDLGTLFSITAAGRFKSLASFDQANGAQPLGLASAPDGTVYGITAGGGAHDFGVVFQITPNDDFTTLYSFPQAVYPGAFLTFADGNLYGTTFQGGVDHLGSIFRMTPEGVLTDFASFDGTNGQNPSSDMVQWEDGYFYMERLYKNMEAPSSHLQWRGINFCGVATTGGESGNGAVYHTSSSGVISSLANFSGRGAELGAKPTSLIAGLDGNLYGTTLEGGRNNDGTIFRLEIELWPKLAESGAGHQTDGLNLKLPPIVSH